MKESFSKVITKDNALMRLKELEGFQCASYIEALNFCKFFKNGFDYDPRKLGKNLYLIWDAERRFCNMHCDLAVYQLIALYEDYFDLHLVSTIKDQTPIGIKGFLWWLYKIDNHNFDDFVQWYNTVYKGKSSLSEFTSELG